jgi:predicted DNA-binding transcriptional regulator AlpA
MFLTSKQVRERYGNRSNMSLWRWRRDPKLNFPPPITVKRRLLWKVEDLEQWERERAVGGDR